jgi:protein phosphatase 1G
LFGVFDGHGGREVAHYAKRTFEDCLKSQSEFEQANYKEALRKGFLEIDYRLENKGGLDEVAEMKRKNPPLKSPLMKILTESIGNNGGAPKEEVGEDQLQLDSIGCTANVVLCDFKNRKLIVANAGDSRCVMGKGGKCVPLSFDHKPEC